MAALLQHQQQNHNNKSEPGGGEGLGLLPSRSCDTCHAAAAATLYCHHHAAFFCAACDCAVAGSRHERVLMCEVCLQAPAVLSCKADAAALCASCDADVHSANPLAYRHERLPVVPFVGPVDLTRAKHAGDAWRIQNTGPGVDLMADFLCSDSDLFEFGFSGCNYQIYNLEKLTDVNGSFENHHHHHRSFAFADSYVPTKSNGNSSSDIVSNRTIENCFDHHIDKLNSNEQHMISFNNYSALLSASSSETGVVPDGNGNSSSEVSYTFTKPSTVAGGGDVADGGLAGAPTRAADREARVLRYREKRKNRKFQKTIRYASRKAYAETRPRVKGRFAKRTSPNGTSDSDRIYRFGSGPANGFVIDHGGYGVVPSFR